MDEADRQKLVNDSGYPFQLYVEDLISSTSRTGHMWNVVSPELAWEHPRTKEKGFADLVIENGPWRIVVECKRLGQGREYIFLAPRNVEQPGTRSRVNVARAGGHRDRDVTWVDAHVAPESSTASYCVTKSTSDKDPVRLERVGAGLVSACEAIGNEQVLCCQDSERQQGTTWYFFPMLVTNAELYLCDFAPSEVTPDGGFSTDTTFRAVSFVRFQKSLSTEVADRPTRGGLSGAAQQKERTIFVVRASFLIRVLAEWRVIHDPLTPLPPGF